MSEQPLVSIVLPTYNGSRYLAESIQSVLDQTYPAWELIIVDDASTDRTPEIIASYAARDRRIRPMRNDQNKKLPRTLNTGFAAARGAYLTWTSDDNRYRPEAIAEMVAFLRASPGAGLVFADCAAIDETGSVIGKVFSQGPELLPFGNTVGACFMYPARVREAVGDYADDLFLVEDYDYWLRIARSFRIARVPKELYEYREHGGSLTSQRRKAVNRAHAAALIRNLGHIPWISRAQRAKAFYKLAMRCVMTRDPAGAAMNLWRAIRTSPTGYLSAAWDSFRRRMRGMSRPASMT